MYTIRVSKGEHVKIFTNVQADEVHEIRMLYAHDGYHVQIFKGKYEARMSMSNAKGLRGWRIA